MRDAKARRIVFVQRAFTAPRVTAKLAQLTISVLVAIRALLVPPIRKHRKELGTAHAWLVSPLTAAIAGPKLRN